MNVTQSSGSSWNKLLPDDIDIKRIKQKLLSADKEQILEAVEKINLLMCTDKFVVYLIKSDVCEFLCDAVTPSDDTVVENIYGALKTMSKYPQFYTGNHSCFAIESVVRSLYFLLKNQCSSSNVNHTLSLLVFITQGHNTYNITPDKKTMEHLLEILLMMTKSEDMTMENKFQIGSLILNLIQINILNWCIEFYESMLICVSWWFSAINIFSQDVYPRKDKLISLCCTLSYFFLRSENKYSIEFVEIKNNITVQISKFLVNTGLTYFENEFWNRTNNDFTHLEYFFQAILLFCKIDNPILKKNSVHELSQSGFIHLTTKIVSFFDQNESLKKLCGIVLFQIIIILTEDVFNLNDVWPSDQQNFHDLIREGVCQVPLDASEWLDVLENPHTSYSCKLVILLYLYFYTITAKSEVSANSIYASVSKFIIHSLKLDTPVLIIKILWFVYVISDLSSSQCSTLNIENEAGSKLLHELEAQEDLSLVYTHHPAILYWTFSFKADKNIQYRIVRLWLQNKSSDCQELEELIEKSSDVRFTVLDLLLKEQGKVLDMAFSSLKFVLVEKGNADLASNIWYLLPKILAKYSADSVSAKNIDYLIELSSLETPDVIDAPNIIRISFLLPEIIFSSCLISIVPSLKLIYQLLQLGYKIKDSRVVFTFIRSDNFVQKLLEKLFTNISEISLFVIKIITFLWKHGTELENVENLNKIQITKETFVKVLENESMEVLSCSLDFFNEVLSTSFRSPLFQVQQMDVEYLQVLLFHLQNISIKSIPEISQKTWLCLKLFLEIDHVGVTELATNPFFHEIINVHLPNMKNCQEMKDFLKVWMDQNNKINNDCCFERKIFGGFYLETVRKIAQSGEVDKILQAKIEQAGVFT